MKSQQNKLHIQYGLRLSGLIQLKFIFYINPINMYKSDKDHDV